VQRRRLGGSGLEVGWLGLAPDAMLRQPEDLITALDALVDAGGDLVQVTPPILTRESEPTPLAHILRDPGRRRLLRLHLRSSAATRGSLLTQLDTALDALGTDSIDVWTLDTWSTGWHEIASAASVALASGRVHYVGLGMPRTWQDVALAGAIQCGPPGAAVAALSAAYSLLDRAADRDRLPAAQALNAGFIAGAPLAHGVLTGKYRHGTPPDSRGASETHGSTIRAFLEGPRRPVLEGLLAAADGLSTSPASVALAWIRDVPGVSAAVVSARTIHQWRGLLGSDGVVLPHEIRSALDDVSAV